MSKFKENDIVRVLPNIKDPDFKENIGGWSGIIEEIEISENDAWLYRIRWDTKTLSKAGNEYIDKCEAENLDYEIMYLEESEIELFQNPGRSNNGILIA